CCRSPAYPAARLKKIIHQKKENLMKKLMTSHFYAFVILTAIVITAGSCKKNDAAPLSTSLSTQSQSDASASLSGFQLVSLAADNAALNPLNIDHNLHNAWGMSADDEGEVWVSAADGGVSYVYKKNGEHERSAVNIPSHDANTPGNPTGNIYNETEDF